MKSSPKDIAEGEMQGKGQDKGSGRGRRRQSCPGSRREG